jgi:hypothetical protein
MEKHGAQSERRVQPLAQRHARRMLRQRGLRVGDLSPVAAALLKNWSRCAAQLELLDAYAHEHGLIDEHGEPRGYARLYFAAINSERHALRALAEHVADIDGNQSDMVIEMATWARQNELERAR